MPDQYGDDDVEVYVWNERLATYVFVPEDDDTVVDGGRAWSDLHLADFSDHPSSSPESIPRPFTPAVVTPTHSPTQGDLSPSPPLSPLLFPTLPPTQQPLSLFSPHDCLHIIVEENDSDYHAGQLDPSRRSPVSNCSGPVSGVVN